MIKIETRLLKILSLVTLERELREANAQGFHTVGVLPGLVFLERESDVAEDEATEQPAIVKTLRTIDGQIFQLGQE